MKTRTKSFIPIKKDFVRTNRFHVPYRVYGNSGPQIVCINGVQQSMAMWHSFIRRFVDEYRIVVFDFPGQGKGKVLVGPTYLSITDQVEILKKIISVSGNSNTTICSASWGGVIALAYAEKYPQSINRMLLGGLGTRPNETMRETIKKGSSLNSNDRKAMAQILINSFGKNLPEEMKQRIVKQFYAMDQESLDAFCQQGSFVLSVDNLSSIIDLKNINVKIILFRAEHDNIIDCDDVEFLANQLPDCRLKVVKNVGHFLHLESDDVLEDYYRYLPDNQDYN